MTYITLWKKRKGKLSSIVLQTDTMEFTSSSNNRVCSIMYYLLAAHFELYVSLNCKKLQKYHYNHIASAYGSSMELLVEDNRRLTIFRLWQWFGLIEFKCDIEDDFQLSGEQECSRDGCRFQKAVQYMNLRKIFWRKTFTFACSQDHFWLLWASPKILSLIRNQVTTFLRLCKLYPYLVICCLISKLSACKEIKSNCSCVVCVETSLIFLIVYYPRFIYSRNCIWSDSY